MVEQKATTLGQKEARKSAIFSPIVLRYPQIYPRLSALDFGFVALAARLRNGRFDPDATRLCAPNPPYGVRAGFFQKACRVLFAPAPALLASSSLGRSSALGRLQLSVGWSTGVTPVR
jgi:hypothetical protein